MAWQPLRSGGERHLLSEGFHLSAEVANAAAAELAKLRQRGDQNAVEAVPDGVVPSALAAFLSAVGVSNSELALRLADVIAAQCEGAHWAELARAREVSYWLDALGLHIPGLLGDMARQGNVTCQACQRRATGLFRITTATGTRGRALLEHCRGTQEVLL